MDKDTPNDRFIDIECYTEETQKKVDAISKAMDDLDPDDDSDSFDKKYHELVDSVPAYDSSTKVLRPLNNKEQWELFDKIDFLFNCAQIKEPSEI